MRTNKKLTISAMTSLVAVALAGSVTSTIAWYQYSTRANVAYLGSSAGTSGNLHLRIKGETNWTTQLSKTSVQTYLESAGYDLSLRQPVTPSLSDVTNKAEINFYDPDGDTIFEPKFYANPIFGKDSYNEWLPAKKGHYVSFPLELRYVSRAQNVPVTSGASSSVIPAGNEAKNIAKNVYLSDLLIQKAAENPVEPTSGGDISDAVRVHLHVERRETIENEDPEIEPVIQVSKDNFLISKNGGTTVTHGRLDIDGDGNLDRAYPDNDIYGFDSELHDVVYGLDSLDEDLIETPDATIAEGKYMSFAANNSNAYITGKTYYTELDHVTGAVTAESDANIEPILAKRATGNSQSLENLTYDADAPKSKKIGTTIESETEFLTVVVTIWVEGWHKFALYNFDNEIDGYSSIWDETSYITAAFNVGLQFAVQTEDPINQ